MDALPAREASVDLLLELLHAPFERRDLRGEVDLGVLGVIAAQFVALLL